MAETVPIAALEDAVAEINALRAALREAETQRDAAERERDRMNGFYRQAEERVDELNAIIETERGRAEALEAALREAPCYPDERCLPNQPKCRRHRALAGEPRQVSTANTSLGEAKKRRARVAEPERERLAALIEELPAVVFASDDKEREMLAKSVVLTVIRNAGEPPTREHSGGYGHAFLSAEPEREGAER